MFLQKSLSNDTGAVRTFYQEGKAERELLEPFLIQRELLEPFMIEQDLLEPFFFPS